MYTQDVCEHTMKKDVHLLLVFILSFIVWTGVFVFSLWYNLVQIKQYTAESALIQARTAFEKDVVYRRWNSYHNGVMVPVVPGKIEPNPYLDPKTRDMLTADGVLYTKVNPAYMTRLVYELGALRTGVEGHITSSKPIRKGNEPDSWEKKALDALEKGEAKEVSSVEIRRGARYMRYIAPLITESGCLSCHAYQGYKVGEVRGAISISVPMSPLEKSADVQRRRLYTSHMALWFLGILGLSVSVYRLDANIKMRDKVEYSLRKEIKHRKDLEDALREQANMDALTRLTNRRAMQERLDMEIARHKRADTTFSVLLLDIDHFKQVNDTKGHEAGDKVLNEVALRMKQSVRAQDAVARWGGEEFLIALPETPLKDARLVAEKIRDAIASTPIELNEGTGDRITVTISIGVSEFKPNTDISLSIRCADEALYQAKKLGRNRTEISH